MNQVCISKRVKTLNRQLNVSPILACQLPQKKLPCWLVFVFVYFSWQVLKLGGNFFIRKKQGHGYLLWSLVWFNNLKKKKPIFGVFLSVVSSSVLLILRICQLLCLVFPCIFKFCFFFVWYSLGWESQVFHWKQSKGN